MRNRPYRVLISQVATIPHYRVRFYELLEQRRPPDWTFEVVFDTRESDNPSIYVEPVDYRQFKFSILDARTTILPFGSRKLIWQHYFLRARHCDLIITDTHLSNLTYVATHFWRLFGTRRAFWGHLQDMNVENPSLLKRMAETLKRGYIRTADFFFVYTEGLRRQLVARGFPESRLVVLHNTIDTVTERAAHSAMAPQRDEFRRRFGVEHKQVLLYVGRLLPAKRLEFLLEAFKCLRESDPNYHLFVVGGGPLEKAIREAAETWGRGAITAFGPLVGTEQIGPVYEASDLYVLPGFVGLAPLQAFCHDLPAVVFDLKTHSPEIEYLDSRNSVILPAATTAQEFAQALPGIMEQFSDTEKRAGIFESIRHLAMETMVDNYISGVNRALGIS
ncbi:MAG: glycosyltransferase family 4 protein [Candidatus Sumerlaeaceae bacterium]|nr:glycosyltransferase family 4 protein [Candidatus Sumerlaeaceae bacterium]